MTINITCDGKQYRVIKKECAYILSVSIQNSSGEAVLDLDECLLSLYSSKEMKQS